MQDILMEINNLSYRYEDGTLALDQVSLQIRRHERLAIMGQQRLGQIHPVSEPERRLPPHRRADSL